MNIPIPARTPKPDIQTPTAPRMKPQPVTEQQPPGTQPPPKVDPPKTMPPVMASFNALQA